MLKPIIVLTLAASGAIGVSGTGWIGIIAAAPPGTALAPQSAQTVYADVEAKEKAVRTALAGPRPARTLLKAVRTVVADYERFVGTYPTNALSDDALWQAGRLSLDAFAKFRDPQEKDASIRLLSALVADYPTSGFVKQVAAALAPVSQGSTVTALPRPAATTVVPAAAANRTAAPAKIVTVKDIRRAVLPEVVRIIIELDGEVPFQDERLENPARVFVDLSSTQQSAALVDRTEPGSGPGERVIRFAGDSDKVRQVRIGRHANNVTRVVLDATGVSSYSVFPLYSPYRLVIDCIRATPITTSAAPALPSPVASPVARLPVPALPAGPVSTAGAGAAIVATANAGDSVAVASPIEASPPEPATPPLPAIATATVAPLPGATSVPPPPSEPARNIAGGFSIARQLGLTVSRIVIDPGHGGHDPGAKGGGQTEADLVLDIALRVEKLLATVPGVEVVLTRRTDAYVPLQERTAIANRENADLFLSIHANASRNKQARGVETYFLNFATNETAAAVAARENAASGQAMGSLPDVVKTIALNNKLDESRDLATIVQRAVVQKLRPANKSLRDLGVKQAPFVVLIGAAMPSVLAEISFLTNASEAKLLKTPAYRQKIAEALFNAVRSYQTSLKTVSKVAETPKR